MRMIYFSACVAVCLFLVGCANTAPESPQNINLNTSNRVNENIYEGTYSFYYNEYFIEGGSGHLWRIHLPAKLKNDFNRHWSQAIGSKRPLSIAKVRFRGTVKWVNDNPPVGIKVGKNSNKFVPYKDFTVTKVISVTVPGKLNPANCYSQEIPCSSEGLAQFSGKLIKH